MSKVVNQDAIPSKTLYTGDKIPGIGLGTFGSDKYNAQQVAEAVYGAIKTGYRMIDCAAVYQNEDVIGESLSKVIKEGVVKREDLFITSKVWNDMHKNVIQSCRKSLRDLQVEYLDLYLIHWPFPNYHIPGCDVDYRSPDAREFSTEEFIDTWRQCEQLVDLGLVRHIGMSNMTVTKMEAVLPLCKIAPAVLEMELHPSFQQSELFDYAVSHDIVPIGYCPIGSPSRPERDRTADDVADTQMPVIMEIAKAHNIHPAIVCLKWAVQRGQIPIPFSVKEEQYFENLEQITKDPLSSDEMEKIKESDKNCRLVKGHVFLWNGAKSWEDLWK
jgi:diketogulonate reductase-like aldo/keto reductase